MGGEAKEYFESGLAKYNKVDYDGAMADFDKAIQLKPDDAEAYLGLGTAKDDKGDYDGAIADFDKAIQLNPDHAAAYNNRGYTYEKMGDFERAIKDYRKALTIGPGYPIPRKNLDNLFTILNGNPEFVKKVQLMLSIIGYYRGDIDGVSGERTRNALMAFQMDSKLTMTGEIDDETHLSLTGSYKDAISQTSTAPLEEGGFQVNFPREDGYETTEPSVRLDAFFKGDMEIESIVVGINDQKVKGMTEPDYNLRRTSASIDYTLPLSRGSNLITLTAFTKQGDVVKRKISVIYNPEEKEKRESRKWAVIIGIEDYEDAQIQDLDFTVDDAEEFAQTLMEKAGFSGDRIILLTDKEARKLGEVKRGMPTSEGIRRALFTRLRETRREDSVIIYYSGHGALVPDPTSPSGKTAYLLPVDFEHVAPEVRGIRMEDIKRLAYLAPERMFLIIDSCYSGGGEEGVKALPSEFKIKVQDEITRGFAGKGRVLLTSCKDSQISLESEKLENSVFTYYLVDILKRERRLDEIYNDVYSKVKDYTNGAQEPQKDVGDQTGEILLY